MSPHRIAGPLDRSSINSGNKTVDWPEVSDPLTLPNLVAIQQEVYEISAVENLCSRKSGPKFTTMGDYLLYAQMPLSVPKFIALGQMIFIYLFIYYEYRTKYTHTSTHKKENKKN